MNDLKEKKSDPLLTIVKIGLVVFVIIIIAILRSCASFVNDVSNESKERRAMKATETTTVTTSFTLSSSSKTDKDSIVSTYVVNTDTKVAHTEYCSHVNKKSKNMKKVEMSVKELKDYGYSACTRCRPF